MVKRTSSKHSSKTPFNNLDALALINATSPAFALIPISTYHLPVSALYLGMPMCVALPCNESDINSTSPSKLLATTSSSAVVPFAINPLCSPL